MNPVDQWPALRESLKSQLSKEDIQGWLDGLEMTVFSPGQVVLSGVTNQFFLTRIQARFLPLIRQTLLQGLSPSLQPDFSLEILPRPNDAPDIPNAQPNEMEGFAGYIEAPCNQFALKMALDVVRGSGVRHSPFMVVGQEGEGKTFLLRAMVHHWNKENRHVVFLTGEQFTNEVLGGFRLQKMAGLRNRYRTADVFILDDLEGVLKSPSVQEELVHTLDALDALGDLENSTRENPPQVVFSAGAFPSRLPGINSSLASRLEKGLVAEIFPADDPLRARFLEHFAQKLGLQLDADTRQQILKNIHTGLSRLEGVCLRIQAHQSIQGTPLHPTQMIEIASPLFDPAPSEVFRSPDEILGAVCDACHIPMKTLLSENRSKNVAHARQLTMYLLRENTTLSFQEIGKILGNRSHSAVIHGCNKISTTLETDQALRNLTRKLQQGFY